MARLGRLGILSTLKLVCVVVCFAATGGGVLAQQQPSGGMATEKTVLRGTVVNSVTHQPIGRALVKSTDGRFATMTNERGQFEMRFKEKKNGPRNGPFVNEGGRGAAFSDGAGGITGAPFVTSGQVSADQQGQVQQDLQGQQQLGQQGVDRPDFFTAVRVGYLNPQTSWGNGIAVARDQEELTISLTPEAKVVGHVTLADGEGAAGIPLELYRLTVQDGHSRWNNVGSVQARSDGEFRFADLEAGTYKLFSAELPDRDPVSSDPRGQGYGYPPDYFPGASDFAGGAVIHLTAGETFQASLTPEKRRYYPVHIGVNNGGQGRQFDIQVEREGHPGPGFSLGNDFRDGSIGGMLPDGNYLVRVSTQDNAPLTGLVNLSVRGGPVGAMVTLLAGMSIDVRVIKEINSLGPQLSNTTVGEFRPGMGARNIPIVLSLIPVEEFGSGRSYMAGPQADPAAEGLVIEGVPAGEYRVTTQFAGGGYVAGIRCGEKDLLESNLVVGGGASVLPIEVTLRNDGAEIDGSIIGMAERTKSSPTMPTAAGYVYIVPARGGEEVKSLVSQPNGDFAIQQLAPGTYRVFAFDRPRNDVEFSNEEAIRKFDAQVVTLLPGQKEKVRVSLNPE